MILTITGIDASGKETQSKMLNDYLKTKGNSMLFSFPDYDTEIGKLLKKALQEDELHPYYIQGLHTLCRMEKQTKIKFLLDHGYNIVCDRYILDSIIYGSIHGCDVDWLYDIHHHCYQSDLDIFVDITVDESFKRKPNRADNYEKDYDFLNRIRNKYLEYFSNANNGYIVNGMQSVEKVHQDIINIVDKAIKKKGVSSK